MSSSQLGGVARVASLVMAVAMASCGPPPRPLVEASEPVEQPEVVDDPNVDVGKARELIAEADRALGAGKLDRARKLLLKAEPFANDTVREEIRKLRQRIDSAVADDIIPKVLAFAEGGRCADAAAKVGKAAAAHEGTTVVRFVKDKTSQAIVDCLLKALVIDVSIARELAESEDIARALAPDHLQMWQEKVADATIATLIEGLQEPIQQRDWVEVVKQLDELVARREAGKREQKRIMELVRQGVSEDVEAKVAAGMGKRSGAATLLAEVDALIAAARWAQGKAVKDDPVPVTVAGQRELAAFWVQCAAVDCKMVTPTPVWAYGAVEVKPVLDVTGETVETVAHARKLWRIGESPSWALVAARDPGPLEGVEARLPAALGWTNAGAVRSEDTSEWLPPADAIVGTRVWGPLRQGEQTWELGTVVAAKGGQLDVKRFADLVQVQVPSSQVRFGTIKEGTKVLAQCHQPLTPTAAVIERVIDSGAGDPVATLACLEPDGQPGPLKRQAQLGSLRTKASWLPPRR